MPGLPTAAWPIAAAAVPPSTIAPSPPMTTRPSRAGSATHSAVSSSGAARDSVFWIENQLPKPPRHIRSYNCVGDLPTSRMKTLKSAMPAMNAANGMTKASARRAIHSSPAG